MKFKWIHFLLLSIVLTCCTPSESTSTQAIPTDTPSVVSAIEDDSIIVTSASNSGPGSLRQALLDAWNGEVITFDPLVFPPDNPTTIYISGDALPEIHTGDLILDASNAGVILDGSLLGGDWTPGLQIVNSSHNQIMGLHILNFTGAGIAVSGTSSKNIIGGDRSIGEGPWGQGNLLSNNNLGIIIYSPGSTENKITGNLIGVDMEGNTWLGNEEFGIQIMEGARENIIGPDNIISYNFREGIYLTPDVVESNEITQNRIVDNGIGIGWPAPPVIIEYDLAAGSISGATCANCTISMYSNRSDSGELTLKAQTDADGHGLFSYEHGEAFSNSTLKISTTTPRGRVSLYPTVISGAQDRIVLQSGNEMDPRQYFFELPGDLIDNHMGPLYGPIDVKDDYSDFMVYSGGSTRARVHFTNEPEGLDWSIPEMEITEAQDEHFTRLADNDISITFILMFYDKETYPNGEGAPCARFKTEEEVERWLEYVRYTVDHLKDWVDYFEIWNEPDIAGYCPKWIEVDDYINLVSHTVPVIRETAPEAKIVVGAVSKTYYPAAQNYLFRILESELMPMVDGVSWHPFYGESPKYNTESAYYYNYPNFVEKIMGTAEANGFTGEYHASEISYRMEPHGGQYGEYTAMEATKYFTRAIFQHRGMGISPGGGSTAAGFMIRRLTTLMAGVEPADFTVEIQSSADNIVSYSYTTHEGAWMVGLWTNGLALEEDPGVEASIKIPGAEASEVVIVDVLDNIEQNLVFEIVDGDLVIENLLVRDYPLAIKLLP